MKCEGCGLDVYSCLCCMKNVEGECLFILFCKEKKVLCNKLSVLSFLFK